jgi:hypothetical protein
MAVELEVDLVIYLLIELLHNKANQ